MNKRERVIAFMNIMETIEKLIGKCERIGWDEIHAHETHEEKDAGWAMQGIASHMLWWIYNSSEYDEEWELLEKIREGK